MSAGMSEIAMREQMDGMGQDGMGGEMKLRGWDCVRKSH
jgi:hypothetical protein